MKHLSWPQRVAVVPLCLALSGTAAPLPLAAAQDDPILPPAARTAAPDTSSCPHQLVPPEARTTSETPRPGTTAPAPLPVTPAADGLSCGVNAPVGFHVPESVLASSWIVADLDSGEVIATKDPHGRYRPASVIKVLLARVALERLDLDATITASDEAAGMEGSAVGIGPGGTYTIRNLLEGLLMASGNDAATALAEQLGGEESTLRLVNEMAARDGAQDTRVMNFTGLDRAGQSSSAFDLALFYREAWKNPVFAEIVNTDHVDFPGWGENKGFEVWNDNGLLLNDPDGIGGKTGYTDDANHTFVGATNRGGRRLVAILLDTTVDRGRPWEQARDLLDAAYRIPAGQGVATLTEAGKDASREGSDGTSSPNGSDGSSVAPSEMAGNTAGSAQGWGLGGVKPLPLALGVGAGILAIGAIAVLVWKLGRPRAESGPRTTWRQRRGRR